MNRRKNQPLFRAVAGVLAFAMLLSPVAPFGFPVGAQPVTVPPLVTPAFNGADLDPSIAAASQAAGSQPHWEILIEQARILLGAAWETQADAAIAAQTVAVTRSDAYNANANYQQYLLNELVIQKEAAREQWMTAAERYIDQHRIAFLSSNNGDGDLNEFFEDSDSLRDQGAATTQSGENGDLALSDAAKRLEREREIYRLRMRAHIEETYSEYQGALGRVNADRDAYMQAVAAADAQFQTNLAQIDAYEDQVRAGIQTLTSNLSNYLASSDQFYATTVNADNTLSVDRANMNPAGITLQNLLNQVQTGLTNRDPLSTLATQLTSYLQNRQTQARTNATAWDNQIYTDVPGTLRTQAGLNWPVSASPVWDPALRGNLTNQIQNAINTDPAYAGVRYAIEALQGNATNLRTYLRQGDRRTVSGVANVSVCGRSPVTNYNIAPGQIATASNGECFSTAGYDFGVWDATAIAGVPPVIVALVGMFPEDEYHWFADYTLHDANAEANRDTWNTYDSQLGAMITQWQNDVLPAIQNWETQSAQYQSNYAAWQAQANIEVAAYNADYESSVSRITAQRNYYLAQMDTEIRKGLGQFRDLARKISVAESEARQNELIEAASLQRDIEIAEFNYATAENLREAYMVSMEPRPRVNETFLNRADQGVPDYASFAKAAQSIGETLSGALNVAVVEDLNDKANKEQKNATDSLKAMLERSAEISDKDLDDALEKRREEYLEDQAKKPWKYVEPFDAAKERQQIKDSFQEQIDREQWRNVTVSSTGVITATRRIAKGNVTLRAGEDATESESYDVEYEEQTINFQGAGAIRLGETAGLFSEEFDTGKANQNFYDDLDAFAEAFNEQVVGLTDLTSQANKSLSARWSGAQKNIQNQVKIANTAASLVQGIAGGGFNFAQWAQGVVNGEVSQIFEEAFNVPAGLLVNMANGMNLGKAASKWLESAAYDFLEQATGVQGMAAFAREAIDKINKNARVGRMRDQAMGKNLSTSDFTNSLKGAAAGGVVPGGQLLAGANTLQSFAEFGAAGGRYLAHEFEHSQFGKTVLDAPFKITKVMSDAFMMPPLPFTSYESAKGFVQDSMDYARGSDRKAIRARMDERLEEYADRAKDQGSLKKLTSIKPLSLLGDYVGAVLSPITQGLGKPNVPASQTTLQMRETMGNTIASALNLPATMTRMMMFEGANLDEAMTAQAFANIEAAVGIPGIADHYQRALERYHFKQRKDAAGGLRPEDYLTMGSTYLWRNAEYNKDLGVGLQVAETVGGIVLNTVGNIIPGVGTGIWLAYNALKQSYMGSLKGGTRGAIAGYMSAGLTAFTSQFGVNAGVSYSYEDGWGGQVGVTLPIGDTSLSGSAGINFQEGEGITGTSVGAGYNFGGGSSNNPNTGYQGGIGLSFDQYGDFAGGNLNFGYGAQTEGGDNWYNPDVFNVGGSLNFDRDSFTGIGLNVSGTNLNHLPGGLTLAHTLGAGLTFNFDGSAGFSISQSLGYNNATGFGINGLDATNSGSFWWDEDGEFQGVTNTITLGADWQSKEDAHRRALQERERVNRLLDAEQDPVKRAELGKAWNDLNDEIKGLDPDRRVNGWNEKLEAKVAAGDISQERFDEIRADIAANPDAMNGEALATEVWGTSGDLGSDTSRGNWFTQALGTVGDGLKYVFGFQSDEHGFVDDQGNYHERTCFTAGTWVRVKGGTPGAFFGDGRSYKFVEDVRSGDWVLSWNEKTGELEWKQVSETFVRKADRVYVVVYDSGQTIETTWSHPFYLISEGWVEARKLRAGDVSKTATGEARIASVTVDARHETVYNFSVAENHNYFVGRDGVLVHNSDYFENEIKRVLAGWTPDWLKGNDFDENPTYDSVEQRKNMEENSVYQLVGTGLSNLLVEMGIAEPNCELYPTTTACMGVIASVPPFGLKGGGATRGGAKVSKVIPPKILKPETVRLVDANINNSGIAVLGNYRHPQYIGYIEKAKLKDASYYDLGSHWNQLSNGQRWAANRYFLDKITAKGDKILVSTPKNKIRPESWLSIEIEYLTKVKGYKWRNQWTLTKDP